MKMWKIFLLNTFVLCNMWYVRTLSKTCSKNIYLIMLSCESKVTGYFRSLVFIFLVTTRLPVEGNDDSSTSLGVIIGASAGGTAVLLIILLIITCCYCMGRK